MTIKALRHRDGALELPTVTLLGPQGHRVDLVGVMHVAPQWAWDDLIARLQERTEAGALVLREGVGRPSPDTLASLSPSERRGVDSLSRVANLSKHAARTLGLVHQGDVDLFGPGAEVLSGDVTVLEMARLHPLGPWPWVPAALTRLESALGSDALKEGLQKSMLERTRLEAPKGLARTALFLATGIRSSVILEHRDNALVSAVLENTGRDLVAPWGAAHLPGVTHQLLAYGYHFDALSWRPVMRDADFRD